MGTRPGRPWSNTWEPERYLDNAITAIEEYWVTSPYTLRDTISVPGEHRCESCGKFCKNSTGLSNHQRSCKSIPGSRTGQKSVEQVKHLRRQDIWKRLDSVEMGAATLPNCYSFPYLGVHFTGDGNTKHNLELRKARACSKFSSLMDVWTDERLNITLKLNLYRSLVISTFVYGHEAWLLHKGNLKLVNGFNSRCLSVITGREIREEATDPTFDLRLHLRSLRLSHLGHILRMDHDEPLRRVVCSRGIEHRIGDLFMDAPEHESIESLTKLAEDKVQWRSYVNQLAGRGEGGTKRANSTADTKRLIDALPSNSILAYTDGGCDGNGAKGVWGKAGWGAWICRKLIHTNNVSYAAAADLWGPVVTDPSDPFHCGCDVGTNNTGELCGMLNALLWAKRQNGHETFAICYDSMYACNVTNGVWKPKKNKSISARCYDAFCEENKRRKGGIVFIHVKGHSDNDGNDKADERVQWGKESGPYCRFTTNGDPEGDHIDQPRPADAQPPSPPQHHPSPTSRLRNSVPPLNPFSSNLSTIRPRTLEEPTPRTHMSQTHRPRSNTLGQNGNFFSSAYIQSAVNNISCRRQLNFSSLSSQDTTVTPSSLPSQADDTNYRPSSPSTPNGEDTINQRNSSLSPSSYDTNTCTSSSNSTNVDDTNYRPFSPSTLNGEPAQSAIPIYRFRSATLRARTIRLAKESTKSALPRYSPSRSCDIPLASNALNGRKHTYNLRNRHTKSNTG